MSKIKFQISFKPIISGIWKKYSYDEKPQQTETQLLGSMKLEFSLLETK